MKEKWSIVELKIMRRALVLARKGLYGAHPNPMVGCVIAKNGRIISEGYHKEFGSLHAEIMAINKVKDKSMLEDSDLFLTLEPCTHIGKQPPCIDTIRQIRWRNIYIASEDCDKRVCGEGIKILRKDGFSVRFGLLEEEAINLNKVFFTFKIQKRPFITLKAAVSTNGFLAWKDGHSKWLSCEKSLIEAHKLRAEADGILVGRETVQNDNPELTTRLFKGRSPKRFIIDRRNKLSLKYKVFEQKSPVTYYITTKRNLHKEAQLAKNGHKMIILNESNNKINMEELMFKLHELDISHLLVEGGGKTISEFINNSLFDKLILCVTPFILPQGRGFAFFNESNTSHPSLALKLIFQKNIGQDLWLEYQLLKEPYEFA
ncbi:MAG: bifunctional diaminohydroxyphosphoribosylaminopyrimidine deaminase/5-amino-6-(5-phosphoribosylamino)uracil reductase RibD [Candidatus Coatesbacteria bacterium]|nr:bifunctional diaminohydroxyphosphoribosylaminopyrimidine deaminase/5-amino-6-(5-phosphoribosylamino)uracil reductase RibD [Candidatus Coatesbacteria bacterium]